MSQSYSDIGVELQLPTPLNHPKHEEWGSWDTNLKKDSKVADRLVWHS